MTSFRNRRRNEAGSTLVELVVAISIMAVIMVVLTASLILSLRTNQTTLDRLASSHDRQQLADFLVGDAQSASSVTAAAACGVTGTVLLNLHWAEPGATYNAVYSLVSVGGGEFNLNRTYCGTGVTTSSTSILHNITPANVQAYSSGSSGRAVALTIVAGTSYAPLTATRRSDDGTSVPIGTPPPNGGATTTTAAQTTTTTSLVTTTTVVATTTTTSTTVPPICAGTLALSPTPSMQNKNATALKADVMAIFTATNSACTGSTLTLHYSPGAVGVTHNMIIGGPTTWNYTIVKNADTWTANTKTFNVYVGTTEVSNDVLVPLP